MTRIPAPVVRSVVVLMMTALITGAWTMCDNDTGQRRLREIAETEAAFAALAEAEGPAAAFYAFAADSAVISRGGSLIRGRAAIAAYYGRDEFSGVSLRWSPSFIDVSSSGDLAYTYGPYIMERRQKDGTVTQSRGIFHTVWRRQADGTWKYVWD